MSSAGEIIGGRHFSQHFLSQTSVLYYAVLLIVEEVGLREAVQPLGLASRF